MTSKTKSFCGLVSGLLLVAACAGRSINNVGELNGNAGGAAGSGGSTSASAGAADSPSGPLSGAGQASDFECGDCRLLANTPNIIALAADEGRVAWVEYGTTDELGNYKDDGRLLTMPAEGGTPTVVRENLRGPARLWLVNDGIYVVETQPNDPTGAALLSLVALDGRAPEVLQESPSIVFRKVPPPLNVAVRDLVVNDGVSYWAVRDESATVARVYRHVPGATTELVQEVRHLTRLLSDGVRLYLHLGDDTIQTMSLAGGQPSPFRRSPSSYANPLRILGGFEYLAVQENDFSSTHIGRIKLDDASYESILEIDTWFDSQFVINERGYVTGSQPDSDHPLELLDVSFGGKALGRSIARLQPDEHGSVDEPWTANDTAVFLTDGESLFRVARTNQ